MNSSAEATTAVGNRKYIRRRNFPEARASPPNSIVARNSWQLSTCAQAPAAVVGLLTRYWYTEKKKKANPVQVTPEFLRI